MRQGAVMICRVPRRSWADASWGLAPADASCGLAPADASCGLAPADAPLPKDRNEDIVVVEGAPSFTRPQVHTTLAKQNPNPTLRFALRHLSCRLPALDLLRLAHLLPLKVDWVLADAKHWARRAATARAVVAPRALSERAIVRGFRLWNHRVLSRPRALEARVVVEIKIVVACQPLPLERQEVFMRHKLPPSKANRAVRAEER